VNPKNPKPKRAVGYVRISKDRDDETSTTTQEARIRAYCTAHALAVVDVIVEPGRSAYKTSRTSRPGLTRAKGLIASGAADVLVCWKLDRVARNTVDTLNLVEELAEHGAQLASVTEHFDTSTPTGEMTLTVLAALARMESATKSERTQAWQEHRRNNGAVPTGPRPFGYRRERNELHIDPVEAAVIRKAADGVLAGQSFASIVADVAAAGVVGRSGRPFARRTLYGILTGPTVAGCREKPPGSGVFIESEGWEPILERPVWEAVRAVLKDPARRSSPSNARRWWLSGIAQCGRCQGRMKVRPTRKGARYTCAECQMSVDVPRTDEVVESALLALLDRKAWQRLRQGQSVGTADTTGYEEAMAELTARFVAEDIDAAELAELAEALRRQQQVVAAPPPPLPDVADLKKAWPKLDLEARRLVLSAATESLTIKPAPPREHRFDEKRIVWVPVA
jgi:site-specific DNA recombinase